MLNEKQRAIASHHGISDDEAVIVQILEDVEVVHTHRVRRAANLARGLREYVRYAETLRLPDKQLRTALRDAIRALEEGVPRGGDLLADLKATLAATEPTP